MRIFAKDDEARSDRDSLPTSPLVRECTGRSCRDRCLEPSEGRYSFEPIQTREGPTCQHPVGSTPGLVPVQARWVHFQPREPGDTRLGLSDF
jgi:hypothetical protein